jgi:hypothetical protein
MSGYIRARLIILASSALLAGSSLTAPTTAGMMQQGTQKDLAEFKITPKQDSNDFHLSISNQNKKLLIDQTKDGPSFARVPSKSDADPFTIDWTAGNKIAKGGTAYTFGVSFVKADQIKVTSAFFSDDKGKNIQDVTIPGFKAIKDGLTFTIFNDLGSTLGIRGLQFLVNSPELSFDAIDPGSLSGFDTPRPDFSLSPGQNKPFDLVGNVDDGNFIYAHGFTYDVNTGLTTGAFVLGGQFVPEPASLVMAGTAALMGLGYAWRRRRHAAA